MAMKLTIQVGVASGEDDILAERALRLAAELRDQSFEVRPAASNAAAGTRGDVLVTGGLLITLASSGALVQLFGILRDWLKRNETHSITLRSGGDEITITGRHSAQDDALIEEFRRKIQLP